MARHPIGRHHSPELKAEIRRRLAAGQATREVADALGVWLGTVQRERRDLGPDAPPPAAEAPSPVEVRDAAFWRRRHKEAVDALADVEAQLRAVTGLLARSATSPHWLLPAAGGKRHRAAGLLHISDLHVGEVVLEDETNGLNRYDPDVFTRRIRRLFSSTIEVLPRWASDCDLRGVVVAVNGDLVSGDIHDELRRTNELTAHEQAYLAADELCAGLEKLAGAFGAVLAVWTPGNHGRTTEKTHAKRVAGLSYDMLVGEMVRRHFATDDRVTIVLAPGSDAVYPVLGWTVHQSHGDSLGTGGGKGFAGPMLPIVRGTKAVEWQASLVRRHYDVILTAHYHTSGNPGGGKLANGSVVGYSEFANRIRAGYEVPQQWLALVHERWGIRERCEIKLEDPVPPPMPRVRVPVDFKPA